jgi:NAD(P)-dependent dehydrogenase (short-subunit alcohol dehydrogenase family)
MNNKIALITGTSTGFGKLLVPAFLQAGWTTIATMRNAEQRRSIFANEQQQYGDQLHCLELDVTKETDRTAIADFIQTRFDGKLDCLVNNAGYGLFGAVEDMSETQIRAEMEVNFFGLVLTTRQLLPQLRAAHGRIINISSLLGFSGMPLGSMYCASKFAVEGFSESLAFELAPHNVQVAIVEPGGFKTNFDSNHLWSENSWNENSPYIKQTKGYQKFREGRATGNGDAPDPVTNAVLKLSSAKKIPLRVRCGNDSKSLYLVKRILPARLQIMLMNRAFQKLFT